jgi:predicted ABC-type transport system involved in lysophospholipase L1 biosynthesis ATPase subunit
MKNKLIVLSFVSIVIIAGILLSLKQDMPETVITITHDISLAARTDRRIHIVDGEIARS